MKTIPVTLFYTALFSLQLFSAEPPLDYQENWPQWRGPSANGVAPMGNPPQEWSENKNIKWKIPIPGRGHATPVIWDDLIFILTATATDKKVESSTGAQTKGNTGYIPFNKGTSKIHQYQVLAINRSDGSIAWQNTARQELPHEGIQMTASWASGSPITDGTHIYAWFGSKGLYCYDMSGNLVWDKDLGDMIIKNKWGEGSSPVLYEDRIVVNWDHEGQSYITALDKKTGNELWKIDRDEGTTWTTPLVIESQGTNQVITSGRKHLSSYNLDNGELLWEMQGLPAPEVVPTPVTSDDLLLVMCGGGRKVSKLRALKLSTILNSQSSPEALVWSLSKDTPYIPSPLLKDNILYFIKGTDDAISAFNAETGEEYYRRQKLGSGGFLYASPVAAGGRIYIPSRNGETSVINQGINFEVLSLNKLNDNFSASPAVVGNELYLRGEKYLYCISAD